ncbi:MAG: hypothetical protein R3C56_36090 [Pirellulaceae bacterium]
MKIVIRQRSMAAKLPTTPVAFCLIFLACRNNMVTTCRLQQSSIRQQYEELCAEGNIVASVPAGTGVMIMANTNVEIFDNDIGIMERLAYCSSAISTGN